MAYPNWYYSGQNLGQGLGQQSLTATASGLAKKALELRQQAAVTQDPGSKANLLEQAFNLEQQAKALHAQASAQQAAQQAAQEATAKAAADALTSPSPNAVPAEAIRSPAPSFKSGSIASSLKDVGKLFQQQPSAAMPSLLSFDSGVQVKKVDWTTIAVVGGLAVVTVGAVIGIIRGRS